MDYSKGGGQGAASCRSLTGLLQSPHFLCSYVLMCKRCEEEVTSKRKCERWVGEEEDGVSCD